MVFFCAVGCCLLSNHQYMSVRCLYTNSIGSGSGQLRWALVSVEASCFHLTIAMKSTNNLQAMCNKKGCGWIAFEIGTFDAFEYI